MYKKSFLPLLAIILFYTMSLSACGGGGGAADNADKSELPKATKKKTADSDDSKSKDKDEDEDDDEDAEKKAEPTKQEIESFLKYAKELIDDELILPKEIIKSANDYKKEFAEDKKWRGNYMIVTVNKRGFVIKTKVRSKIPSIENEDINDAFEAAVTKAQPFRDPPIGSKSKFDFKVRLLGTKSYVTQYKLKL